MNGFHHCGRLTYIALRNERLVESAVHESDVFPDGQQQRVRIDRRIADCSDGRASGRIQVRSSSIASSIDAEKMFSVSNVGLHWVMLTAAGQHTWAGRAVPILAGNDGSVRTVQVKASKIYYAVYKSDWHLSRKPFIGVHTYKVPLSVKIEAVEKAPLLEVDMSTIS